MVSELVEFRAKNRALGCGSAGCRCRAARSGDARSALRVGWLIGSFLPLEDQLATEGGDKFPALGAEVVEPLDVGVAFFDQVLPPSLLAMWGVSLPWRPPWRLSAIDCGVGG